MILHICEKPTTARQLVAALGTARFVKPHGSKSFAGHYQGEGWRVTYLLGHFYSLLEPNDINPALSQWDINSLPILHREEAWKPACESSSADSGQLSRDDLIGQIEHIKSLYATTSSVVIATDADTEGQVIGHVFVKETGWTGPTHRLWTDVWEAESLRANLKSIRPNSEYEGEYRAGVARIIADQALGINFTRLFTLLARHAGHDLVANTGRVRSPAMAIAIDHEARVNDHQANEYYTLKATLSHGQPFTAALQLPDGIAEDGKHCYDRGIIEKIQTAAAVERTAKILSIKNTSNLTQPPPPFNQNTLSQYCAEQFNLMPDQVLAEAQKLYEAGHLSYPRVESLVFEADVLTKVPDIFTELAKLGTNFSDAIATVNIKSPQPVFINAGVSSHSAIYITKNTPNLKSLSEAANNIYTAVAMRLIAQFASPIETNTQKVTFGIANSIFTAEHSAITSPGWSSFMPHSHKESDSLPMMSEGETVAVEKIELNAKKTKAPPRLNVSKFQSILADCTHLLSPSIRDRVKKGQLGTGATQPTYLASLVRQGVLQIQNNKYIISTKRGRELRKLLPDIITSPNLTSLWELRFKAIRAGQETQEKFLDDVFSWLEKTIEECKKIQFPSSPIMTPCERCGSAMTRKTKPNESGTDYIYWICTNFNECKTMCPDHKGHPVKLVEGDGNLCETCNKPLKTRIKTHSEIGKPVTTYLSCGTRQCNKRSDVNGH